MRLGATHLGVQVRACLQDGWYALPCVRVLLELGERLLSRLLLRRGVMSEEADFERNTHVNSAAGVERSDDPVKQPEGRAMSQHRDHHSDPRDSLYIQILVEVENGLRTHAQLGISVVVRAAE